jgi:hypothetical protein
MAKVWNPSMPEPDPDELVSVEAMDCTFRLPWSTVRDDAISGFAAVLTEDETHSNTQAPEGACIL